MECPLPRTARSHMKETGRLPRATNHLARSNAKQKTGGVLSRPEDLHSQFKIWNHWGQPVSPVNLIKHLKRKYKSVASPSPEEEGYFPRHVYEAIITPRSKPEKETRKVQISIS